jgi:hypothetical protein
MRYLKLIVCALLVATWGCANLTGSSSQNTVAPPAQASFYYDFNDIRIPEEMEIQTKESSITPTEGGKFGVMKFKGRAEPISLFDFFFNTMPKDGWTMVTYQKYQRYSLVFTKDNRVCVITIEESPVWYTWLEVKVSPKVANSYSPAYSTGTQPVDTYPAPGAAPNAERTLTQ